MKYTQNERIIKVLLSFLSNMAFVPIVKIMYIHRRYFHFTIGIYLVICTFFYHLSDDLEISILFNVDKWHRLDQIGSLTSLCLLLIYFMNVKEEKTMMMLQYSSILSVIFFQIQEPYQLVNIFGPLVLWFIVFLISLYYFGLAKINPTIPVFRTLLFLTIGCVSFLLGINDKEDYLRIYHSIWHVFISLQGVYSWQIKEPFIVGLRELIFGNINQPVIPADGNKPRNLPTIDDFSNSI